MTYVGTGDVSVRYDGNTFFVFSQILSPSNAPYGLGSVGGVGGKILVGAGSQISPSVNHDFHKPALTND